MKMICNKAGACENRNDCMMARPHTYEEGCDVECCIVGSKCVPVKPKRKPVTVWRVYIDFDNRADARADAKCLREECWHHDGQIRGPVKVVLP